MIEYPSIPKSLLGKYKNLKFYWFEKYDGQNLSIEWNEKKGWCKFTSRTELVDRNDIRFKNAFDIFLGEFGASHRLEHYFKNNKIKKAIVFCEYWGLKSLAGIHETNDEMFTTVIDLLIDKKGFLPPKEFVKLSETYLFDPIINENWAAQFIKHEYLTDELIQSIKEGKIGSFEGVVGKAFKNNDLIMIKIKTNKWIEKIKEIHGKNAYVILES